MPAVQGVECDEELHKWRGIGWVDVHPETGEEVVLIIWGARDPVSHELVFWQDYRSANDQAQIIWGKRKSEVHVVRLDPKPIKLQKFSDKILEATS